MFGVKLLYALRANADVDGICAEQLAEIAKQSGMPGGMNITPEMAKMAAESMKNISPDEMKKMAGMAASMKQPAAFGGSSSSSSTPAPAAASASASTTTEAAARTADAPSTSAPLGAPAAGMPAMTPEMVKMATDMMSNMSPEMLESMSSMMGGAAGAAGAGAGAMPKMTPEMIKAATDMMSKMKPEDIQRYAVPDIPT